MDAPEDSVFREISVVDISDISSVYPVDVSIETIRPIINRDQTAIIEIKLCWRGSNTTTLFFGDSAPIQLPKIGDGSPPSLILLPVNANYDREPSQPECWRPDLDPDYSFGEGLGLWKLEIDPTETISCKAEVWGDHRSSECLPPGEYSFSDNLAVQDYDPKHKEWSFTLEVENP